MKCPHCGKDTDVPLYLTAREVQVLELMRSGILPNKEIANRLGVTPATANKYIRKIFRVLGTKNRKEFAATLKITRRPLPALSRRLRQVAERVISGERYCDIEAELNLAKGTVKNYARKIFNATGADDRYDLALRFTAEPSSISAEIYTSPPCRREAGRCITGTR